MSNGTQQISELLSAPMEAVIIALGTSIAKAQQALDVNSIDMQRAIDEDPTLSELGLQATWYQMPRTELELTMAISMEEQQQPPSPPAVGGGLNVPRVLQPYRLAALHIQPVNAAYTNQFNYDVQASSKLTLVIVPVPPPAAETAVTPRLARPDVLTAAQPFLAVDTAGNLPPDARLAINFNGQAREWFVLEYHLVNGESRRMVLVVIDDDTGQVVKHVKES